MKSTILLLHGAIGAKNQLDKLKEILSKNNNTFSMSFVGHGGRAETSEIFSMKLFGEDVIRFLDEHSISSVSIFGYSMGGYVAMYLAKHYPERINKIVTLGSKFHWTQEIATKEIKMLDAEKIEEKIPKFVQVLRERHSGSNWKLVLEKTKELLINLGDDNTLQLEDYSSIHHSVKVLLGNNDKMVTKEESVAVANKLLNGSFEVVPNSDHPIEKVNLNELVKYINL